MKRKILLCFVAVVMILVNVKAGAPADMSKAYILKKDGTVIEGNIQGMSCSGYELDWVVVNTVTKGEQKFKAKDIQELSFNVRSNVYEVFVMTIMGYNAYAADVIDRDLNADIVSFVSDPENPKAKPSVLQSFNQVLGDYIKVEANESGLYVVSKNEEEIKVTEGSYSGMIETLYGDCPEFSEVFVDGEFSYEDLPKHVMTYNLLKRL